MRFMLALVGEFNMRWGWDRKKLSGLKEGPLRSAEKMCQSMEPTTISVD